MNTDTVIMTPEEVQALLKRESPLSRSPTGDKDHKRSYPSLTFKGVRMWKWVLILALFLSVEAKATPDLISPMFVNLLGSEDQYFDRIEIVTFIINIGDAPTIPKSIDAPILSIGIDSLHFRDHHIPVGKVLNPSTNVVYNDTALVLKGAFSVNTQCDPFFQLGQSNNQTLNDIRSQAYNFHPTIYHDTILLIDTLRLTLHDTIRVTIRDTVIKKDTIKYCPPTTMAKTSGSFLHPSVSTTVYNAVGQPEWTGVLPMGEFPAVRLKEGLHLIVQGANARRFRVAYK